VASKVERAAEQVLLTLDRESRPLSGPDYAELLEMLEDEVSTRLEAFREEQALDG